MRNTTLIDSGHLIALFDKGDKYHQRVLNFLKTYNGTLITTWAVLTEVSHILDFNLNVQLDFLKWVDLEGLTVYEISQKELTHIIKMVQNYANIPMDLADASLIYVAYQENIKNIISIDSNFDIYRTLKNGFLQNCL